ncbi:RNA polymerase sigma factor [Acidicapsa ligni]|uniref:RNA polymerase sigma factor n=1 Tax=Acidicapsa ligni TaxID=542300 RepID=UPI0021DFF8BC|nr:sigma-70 family RNA polymerase sigma factor [Acidicapsa ligni]
MRVAVAPHTRSKASSPHSRAVVWDRAAYAAAAARKPSLAPGHDAGRNAAACEEPVHEESIERTLYLLGENAHSPDKEKDIIRQAILVDLEGQISALYDEYQPRLYSYLRSLGLDEDRAHEAIQETFMRLTKALLQKDNIKNVQGWIVRVAHNLAMDAHTRLERSESGHADSAFVMRNQADPGLNPEETYLRNERIWRMEDALKSFSEMNRQCFYMRLEGFRFKDIAMALGVSEPRVIFVVKQVTMRLAAICG